MNILSLSKNLTVLGTSLILVSCAGQSSDALKNYRDVKKAPVTEEKSDTQTGILNPFVISVKGPSQINYVNFEEGKASSFIVKVEPQKMQTTVIDNSDLRILNFDFPTNVPSVKKINAFEYEISWTPKNGSIPQGEIIGQASLHLVASTNNTVLKNAISEKVIPMFITKSSGVPKIKGLNGLGKSANEGDILEFQIRVEDPTYTPSQGFPIINFPPVRNSNTEAYVASGHRFIDENKDKAPVYNPQTGIIEFNYIMDLSTLPIDYDRVGKANPNSPSVDICFNVNILGSTRVTYLNTELTQTTNAQECVKAFYSAQPAKFQWLQDSKIAKAGQENKFEFILSTENGLAQIQNISNSQISRLSGTKTLECTDLESNSKKCVLNWKPESICGKLNRSKRQIPFKLENKKVELKLVATTDLNGTKKTSEQIVHFEIEDTAEACFGGPTLSEDQRKELMNKNSTENKS